MATTTTRFVLAALWQNSWRLSQVQQQQSARTLNCANLKDAIFLQNSTKSGKCKSCSCYSAGSEWKCILVRFLRLIASCRVSCLRFIGYCPEVRLAANAMRIHRNRAHLTEIWWWFIFGLIVIAVWFEGGGRWSQVKSSRCLPLATSQVEWQCWTDWLRSTGASRYLMMTA